MDELKALAKLIYDSVEDIETNCKARNVNFPSLSEKFTPESEAFRGNPAIIQATGNITAAASQLIALARPPAVTLSTKSIQFHVPSALGFVVEAKVVEILSPAGSKGIHVNEIAQKAQVNPNKLARCLRLLATEHIFTEVAPDVFANNRISSFIDTGKDVSDILANPSDRFDGSNGIAALITHNYREVFKASAYMAENLMGPETANSYNVTKTPFNRALQTDLPLFTWFDRPENKHALKTFGIAMRGSAALVPKESVLQSFDWASLPAGSKFVDVGGGVGTQAMILAREFSHLKYVVQDRAEVIGNAKQVWSTAFPEAVEKQMVELQPSDFFKEQPVTDAAVFFLRAILHDWPDDECIQILKVLRAAATPNTRLLISGFVIHYACHDEAAKRIKDDFKPPAPLLPNGGHANIFDYLVDLQMLVLLNGQERTLEQHEQLFEKSGWKLSRVTGGAYFSGSRQYVEAVPV